MPTYFHRLVWETSRFIFKNTFLLNVCYELGTLLNILVVLAYFEENLFQKFALYSQILEAAFLPDILKNCLKSVQDPMTRVEKGG